MSKLLLARVLVDVMLGSVAVKVNELVEGDPEFIKPNVKAGLLDDTKAAVEYCQKELGAKPIRIEAPPPKGEVADLETKRNEAQAVVTGLEADLAAAADADKAAIQAKLDEANAALAAIK